MTPEPRLTRSEQRDAAREKARQLREANKRKAKTKKAVTVTSLVAVAAAIVGFGVFAIVDGMNRQAQIPNGGTPANMSYSNGIKMGAGLKAFTDSYTPAPDPSQSYDPEKVPNIAIYLDYQCPVCQAFEATNGSQIRQWVDAGAVTLEVHPISFLDGASLNAYSSRAANAAICVANYSPDNFFDFNTYLFDNQPQEQSAGPKDDELVNATTAVIGSKSANIEKCITDKYFGTWLDSATQKSMKENIPGTELKVEGTPTVLVNGVKYTWNSSEEFASAARFAQFVQQAMGQ